MEIIAHIDSAEEHVTWLLECVKCPVLVARALVPPPETDSTSENYQYRSNTSNTLQEHENCHS